MEILNLDKFKPEDKKIMFEGREWIIPGEIPMGIMFQVIQDNQKMETNPNDIDVMKKAATNLWEIISLKNDISLKDFLNKISITMYTKLVSYVFGASAEMLEQLEKETEKKTDNVQPEETKLAE